MPSRQPSSFLPKEVAVGGALAESGRSEPQSFVLQPVHGAASSTARTAPWAGLQVGLPLPVGSYLGFRHGHLTSTQQTLGDVSGHLELSTATRSSAPFPPHQPDAQFQKETWQCAHVPSATHPHAPSVREARLLWHTPPASPSPGQAALPTSV